MRSPESPNPQGAEGFKTSENKEQEAERLASERSGLLDRVLDRALDYGTFGTRDQLRDVFSQTHKEMGPNGKLILGLAKKAPILGHVIQSWEGAAGVDLSTGQKLSSKESLVRNMVATAGAALDVARMIKPGFKIAGKTLEVLGKMTEDSKEKDPESPTSKVLGSIHEFLEANKDDIKQFEEQLEKTIDKQRNA